MTPSPTNPTPRTGRGSPPRRGSIAHLLREKWAEYLVEILVIIFSISASFALDEWKDNRSKRELEQAYLNGLSTDLKTDSTHLIEVITETEVIVGKARELVKEGRSLQSAEFLNDVRYIFNRPRFVAEDATFSDLKSSGNFQVLRDFALKNALFGYYREYVSTEMVEAAEHDATTGLVAPFMVKRLPLVTNRAASHGLSQPQVEALLNDMEFQNHVFVRQATREELLRDYRKLLKINAQIRMILKQESRR
ncbi:MAG: hypothetical protein H7Y12_15880 [Sphingobacteriaceae bacterium]|nr:hypothetical protein [Cytophagaceae bacterium]